MQQPDPPILPPGLCRLRGERLWRHDELAVVWHDGRWCVVPRVTLKGATDADPA